MVKTTVLVLVHLVEHDVAGCVFELTSLDASPVDA